ncbi:MAG: biopolymer transporter ExbD [Thermodesulfobacteriota bacterium]
MAINVDTGHGKGVAPSMNVTPLVDVVLVLLIIFMVITPLLTKKFWVHTPKQEKEEVTKEEFLEDPDPPLVLRVSANREIMVNGTVIAFDELVSRLQRMFAARDDHILFFDAADDTEYGFAVEVMDRAREGGAVTIATLTSALAVGDVSPAPEAVPAAPAATPPAP